MTLSQQYFERSLRVAPGGVHSPVRAFKGVEGTPVFFKSAEGPYLTTVEGERVIDFCQSFGPLILGHRDPDVAAAVTEMIGTAWTFGACEPYSLELAEHVVARIPWVEKIRFVSSGTEAVMSALRVARAATGRAKVLKFDGCYHGHMDALLVKAGSGLAGEASSDSAGVTAAQASDTLVVPLNDEGALDRVFAAHGNEIAAVIIEPLPANYGLLPQRKEFLYYLAEVARAHGTLLIFDEVISGFRVAIGGMAQKLGIVPDLVTYGKILGGGFPVGAYGGRRDLMDQVAPQGPVYQAGTLSANPVGMVAGLTTLQKVERVEVHAELRVRTERFANGVNAIFKAGGLPLTMAYEESLFWIHVGHEVIRDPAEILPGQKEMFKRLFHAALSEGVYLAPSAYEVGFTSWAHTPEVLSTAVEKIERAVSKIL